MITIRTETPHDWERVHELTMSAFDASEHGHQGEAELVATIRASGAAVIPLVACEDAQIVGHILFSPVTIKAQDGESRLGMGLAPLSVTPQRQKAGIGSLLVRQGLERVFHRDFPFVVVLGDPNYYLRFGFQQASEFAVAHGFAGVPQEVFMMKCRSDAAPRLNEGGRAFYLDAFGAQFADGEAGN
jgi:putative acetyltransferase